MGKYSSYSRQKPKPRNLGVHPVMRGIGCIMIVVVPILAYGAAVLLVNYGATRGWPIPLSWFGPPSIPPILWNIQGLRTILGFLQAQNNLAIPPILWNIQGLRTILGFLQAQNNLEANLIFAIAITIFIGGLMSMLYGYIYTLFGPPRYGPQDAPPIRGVKVKRYKR